MSDQKPDALAIDAHISIVTRDAARYRFLRELDHVAAQAYFWNYRSRKARDKAIDAEIARLRGESR